MSFSTKKYTRPVLVNNLKKIKPENFASIDSLAKALSPRAGRKSAQFAALRNYVPLSQFITTNSNLLLAKKSIISNLSFVSKKVSRKSK